MQIKFRKLDVREPSNGGSIPDRLTASMWGLDVDEPPEHGQHEVVLNSCYIAVMEHDLEVEPIAGIERELDGWTLPRGTRWRIESIADIRRGPQSKQGVRTNGRHVTYIDTLSEAKDEVTSAVWRTIAIKMGREAAQ